MSWTVSYHPEVEDDLKRVGVAAARRILRAIDSKLTQEPLQFGVPLSGNLSAFRKLRIGDYRVVYQVTETTVTVFVLAVGPRRDKEVYDLASSRC
ncbi:type II toxin-antitoxin system mRNA interferase toxin, RelE/StbE family [Desulfobulbus sp. F5]|nr:type II toxin-antitoxin system mRNA interferase toxin, RelE/StbE family [Desulfobulbus sp. F3]MCW5200969.1 type II toxin-antitoxin system mRNA interferase toxin, RelE/StbE family [Desulfobulbus sp. F4]MCW5206795.1 type II toxin-antitoxin system mRNA interferase toxin, RelE/StbE family [Desulfobulbus sp. F5]